MIHDMVIYQKMYDLILYAFPIVNRFPKSQRFVLGQEIQNLMITILRLIIQANKEKNKSFTFFKIDVALEELRVLVRLAKDLKFIDVKKYGNISEKISEVGRLLGGWIKGVGDGGQG